MKRIRMPLVLLSAAVAVALPLGLSAAHATGGGGSGTQVTIQEHADYNLAGTQIDVGLYVRCTDPTGSGSARRDGEPVPARDAVLGGDSRLRSPERRVRRAHPHRRRSPPPVPGSTREGPRPPPP